MSITSCVCLQVHARPLAAKFACHHHIQDEPVSKHVTPCILPLTVGALAALLATNSSGLPGTVKMYNHVHEQTFCVSACRCARVHVDLQGISDSVRVYACAYV